MYAIGQLQYVKLISTDPSIRLSSIIKDFLQEPLIREACVRYTDIVYKDPHLLGIYFCPYSAVPDLTVMDKAEFTKQSQEVQSTDVSYSCSMLRLKGTAQYPSNATCAIHPAATNRHTNALCRMQTRPDPSGLSIPSGGS